MGVQVTVLVTVLMVVLVFGVARSRRARWAERDVAARLRLAPSGIALGADPIDLPSLGDRAALLLHGFGDTPQTFGYLAAHLHAHGWAVRAPLLPGHGRTLRDFAASRADDWIRCARTELAAARSQYSTVAVVGLSMGGSLATLIAAEDQDVVALVLLAPYLSMPTRLRQAAAVHRLLGVGTTYLRGRGERSIRDPAESGRSLSYRFTTPRLLHELSVLVAGARKAAPIVTAPTLMIQSRQDSRIPTDAAERAFALFTAPDRRLVWTEGNGHIITVDYGRQRVLDLVADWLATHAPSALPRDAGRSIERPTNA